MSKIFFFVKKRVYLDNNNLKTKRHGLFTPK